jgi:hypothetical protein
MQLKLSQRFSLRTLALAASAICLIPHPAEAGSWGTLLGYNNPAGSKVGLNFLYQGATWGFEFGFGGLAAVSDSDESTSAITWGDLDLKYYFASSLWRPYFEGGMAYSIAAGGAGNGFAAGSPFVGLGVLYSGSRILFNVSGDYKINSRYIYPSAGLGFRL